MASLIELVQDIVTPDVVRRVNSLVGETPATTDSALRQAAPAVLAGVLNNASTPGGAERVCSLVTDGGWGADLLNSLGSRLGSGSGTSALLASGTSLVSSVFGSKADRLTDVIASGAGVQRGSASTILSLAAPIVMSVLGKQMAARGLGASGLSTMLAGEQTSLLGALPASVSGLLGLKDSALSESRIAPDPIVREPVVRQPVAGVSRPARSQWWPGLLSTMAALAILFFVTRGHQADVASTRMDTPSASPRQLASITLPDGARLTVGQGGVVHQLSTFLAEAGATDVSKRFVFDDAHFESGSTRLTPEGRRTVTSLVAVLKAYPSVRVVLEGHTDSTGDPAANTALPQQRAEAVKQIFVDGDVADDRIEVQGYGQERPVADHDSDAGRERNRRLELVITQR